MTFSSTSSSWTPVASSKQSHYGTCEGPIVGVDRIFVAWQFGNTEENEGRKLRPLFMIHTLEIQWGTEPEHGKLEEIPNMAIIPWCSMFHVDGVFFTSGRFSSHHPIFHPSTWYPPTLPFQHLWSWDPTSRAPTKWPLPRLASFESSSFWSSKIHQRGRRGQGGRVIFYRFSQLKIWYDMIWYEVIWYDMIWSNMIYPSLKHRKGEFTKEKMLLGGPCFLWDSVSFQSLGSVLTKACKGLSKTPTSTSPWNISGFSLEMMALNPSKPSTSYGQV